MIVEEPATGAAVPPAGCPGDGISGKRIEILYGYPADKPSRFTSTYVNAIREKVAYADYYLNASARDDGHHFRWLCRDDQSAVKVRPVKTVAIGADGVYTMADMNHSLANQVSLGLGPVNFDRDDRIYLVFMDHIREAGAYGMGGQGQVYQDDRKDPSVNQNNRLKRNSLIAQWSGGVVLHELGHNLGGVQHSAPHASESLHCYDDRDIMCYADGGSFFVEGGTMWNRCSTVASWWFDCGKDDYYNENPDPLSYLGTHWNTADSSWLSRWAN